MMVGSWPCKVLSEIHIDGRRVSELVQKDKGKATVLESEDEKDPREHAWCCPRVARWSGWVTQGVSGDATRVVDRRQESGNLSRVG
jgi:hypothetical protein